MNQELGRVLVLLGLAAAAFGAVTGFVAGARHSRLALAWTIRAAWVFSGAMVFANLVMVRALLARDFSVSYVTKVGSHSSPDWVAVVSLWSSLEGSILFWGAVLGMFIGAFAFVYRNQHRDLMGYALGSMLAVAIFFAFLIAAPANPFIPVLPVPTDGPGPNPLLQNHILMVLHPPTLYFGYVGMTVPFGIALAAALRGRLGDGWQGVLRVWTFVPWIFLTIGIVLGGWWAYEVLGWGGFWAWDPVENASFIPWLVATAYLHAAIVHQRRRLLSILTLSLASMSFLLTVLGTFMTRSGVFNSVHAFSQSSIGPIFLGFLAVTFIISLGALAGRAERLQDDGSIGGLVSRETVFLLFILVILIFAGTVLYGTVYPLVTEAVRGIKVSVGEPYFNKIAMVAGWGILLLLSLGPTVPWGGAQPAVVLRRLRLPAVVMVVVVVGCLVWGLREPIPIFTFALAGFAATVVLRELQSAARSLGSQQRRVGAQLAHLGTIIVIAAVAGSQSYKLTAEASLAPGQSFDLGRYHVAFRGTHTVDESYRFAVVADLEVSRDGVLIATAAPRLNYYNTQREPIGTPWVRSHRGVDVYLSLLSVQEDGSRVAVKAFLNPMVGFLWWSLLLFIVGTAFSLWPRRRRLTAPNTAKGTTA